jgi:hypothetical protein
MLLHNRLCDGAVGLREHFPADRRDDAKTISRYRQAWLSRRFGTPPALAYADARSRSLLLG